MAKYYMILLIFFPFSSPTSHHLENPVSCPFFSSTTHFCPSPRPSTPLPHPLQNVILGQAVLELYLPEVLSWLVKSTNLVLRQIIVPLVLLELPFN